MFLTITCERQLMQKPHYSLLFRWLVGLSMDAAGWDVITSSKNRDRLLDAKAIRQLPWWRRFALGQRN